MKAANIKKASDCIKALGHPVRLSILGLLSERERNVNSLTKTLGISQSNLSQHLSKMRQKNVVTTRRKGNMIYYRISNPKMLKLMALMKEIFCKK